jgi:hypothetical protein
VQIKKYNIVAKNKITPYLCFMHSASTPSIRRLIALLLLAVMVLVHGIKSLHTHHSGCANHDTHQENIFLKDDGQHACSICEFQLAKDSTLTGTEVLFFIPAFASPTYSRLLTNLNSDYLFLKESRGPPQA